MEAMAKGLLFNYFMSQLFSATKYNLSSILIIHKKHLQETNR